MALFIRNKRATEWFATRFIFQLKEERGEGERGGFDRPCQDRLDCDLPVDVAEGKKKRQRETRRRRRRRRRRHLFFFLLCLKTSGAVTSALLVFTLHRKSSKRTFLILFLWFSPHSDWPLYSNWSWLIPNWCSAKKKEDRAPILFRHDPPPFFFFIHLIHLTISII